MLRTAVASLALLASIHVAPVTCLPRGLQHDGPTDLSTRPALKGKFLHVTDFHPDPFYKTYASTDEDVACHRGRGPAGLYGAETSDCDTPFSLVNATFKWIKENLKDEVDFVVWTGDSARHDNDEKHPRTEKQVEKLNRMVAGKFLEVWGKPENYDDPDPMNDLLIPIIPTIGNNDILPHNIFKKGPNRWTKLYLDIWRQFIPEEQRHSFQEGGWFYREVIPKKLAVFSLNSLYFYESNSAVDGCALKSEPGYEHMEWLRIQLQFMRERGMKAILISHVPPARTAGKQSWDETCWQKYTLWMRQYRDVVMGTFYGHMNIDHFMLQDFHDLNKDTKKGRMLASLDGIAAQKEDDEMTIASAADYLLDLRAVWGKLPKLTKLTLAQNDDATDEDDGFLAALASWINTSKKSHSKNGGKGGKDDKMGGPFGERYSMSHVGASIVPNYFPTLRVYEYNISGIEDLSATDIQTRKPYNSAPPGSDQSATQLVLEDDSEDWVLVDTPESNTEGIEAFYESELTGQMKKKKPKKYKFKVPDAPSKTDPPGPAYSPQSLTLLGYTQYFANLTYINNDFLEGSSIDSSEDDPFSSERWKPGKHEGEKPHEKKKPKPHKFKFEIEYNTFNDSIYKLKDLTVNSYLHLAKRISKSAKGKANQVSAEDVDSEDDEGDVEDFDDFELTAEEVDDQGHKKHKKKKHHKKKMTRVWYTFVKRAFVSTMDPEDIEQNFGTHDWTVNDEAGEHFDL
ncbi:Endopolyphosphatase [Aulographum hederae CBS 113979]|uniref:Endopolyphosphatase n=1 Tax=Aulographum hederae CBS 113979 TaxID=1176131 RepID=A0A6G1H8J4_9PEZI|nr:Endopolyphosphatase [Aulographum hederae CBS 113979]